MCCALRSIAYIGLGNIWSYPIMRNVHFISLQSLPHPHHWFVSLVINELLSITISVLLSSLSYPVGWLGTNCSCSQVIILASKDSFSVLLSLIKNSEVQSCETNLINHHINCFIPFSGAFRIIAEVISNKVRSTWDSSIFSCLCSKKATLARFRKKK